MIEIMEFWGEALLLGAALPFIIVLIGVICAAVMFPGAYFIMWLIGDNK